MPNQEKVSSGQKKRQLSVLNTPLSKEKDSRIPSLYKSGNNYFFKISTGKERITVATHCSELEDAEKFRKNYLASHAADSESSPKRVITLINLFADAEKNPKYIEAQATGENYTLRYARMEASRVQHLLALVPSDILDKPLKLLARSDCERVRTVIFKEYGSRSIGADTFKTFKAILNWAHQKGYMKEMITFRMKGIKIEKKEKEVPLFSPLLKTAKNPLCFRTELDMDRFFILLTTGLRRAELSAMQGKQLKRAMFEGEMLYVLDISQSWKDEAQHELGTPKWGIQRVIPLAKETGERLWKYKKGDEDFLMKTSNSVWTDSFAYTQGISKLEITPHGLRHALNTRLIEEGVNAILVQEYFGWHHQDRNKIQEGYTHLYVTALLEVSHAIERIIRAPEERGGLMWLD